MSVHQRAWFVFVDVTTLRMRLVRRRGGGGGGAPREVTMV
jgi:hypothetical protein